MLSSYFKLAENGTTVRTEILAGITTFLTMAYITFVNPAILSDAGMDFGAVFVATCVAAAIGTAIMGLYANYPIALAPGMGLNAFFAYGVVLGMGHSWQVALGAVFLSGILFIILSVLPVREWIINAIPRGLKMAISAGIGLFLAIIALKNAGVVVDHPATLITLGDPTSWPVILAFLGFFAIVALDHRKVPGAVIIGILVVTAAGVALGVTEWKGLASLPPDPLPTFLQLDLGGALQLGLITIVFTLPLRRPVRHRRDLGRAGPPRRPARRAGPPAPARQGAPSPTARRPRPARSSAPRPRPATSRARPGSTPAGAPG